MIYTNYKELDIAGRIVISKDIRKHFDLTPGDMLLVNADDECITIRKAEDTCVFCKTTENLREFNGKHICKDCLDKINAQE